MRAIYRGDAAFLEAGVDWAWQIWVKAERRSWLGPPPLQCIIRKFSKMVSAAPAPSSPAPSSPAPSSNGRNFGQGGSAHGSGARGAAPLATGLLVRAPQVSLIDSEEMPEHLSSALALSREHFPELLFRKALTSRSFEDWFPAAREVASACPLEFTSRLASIVGRSFLLSNERRKRAIALLGYSVTPVARELAAATLSKLIVDSVEPRSFFRQRRIERAFSAIDAAFSLGGKEGAGVLIGALGTGSDDVTMRAMYPLAAFPAGPGIVVRGLVTSAEQQGASARFVRDVVLACQTLNDELTAQFLIRMLSYGREERSDARVRREAGRALGLIREKLSESDVEAVGELLHDERKYVRSAASHALLRLGNCARPALVSISTALDSTDTSSQRLSLRLLEVVAKIKRPEARSVLLSVQFNSLTTPAVRLAAKRYSGEI